MWDCILQCFIFYGTISSKESTHDRVVASRVYDTGLTEYIGREVAPMTAYEIISIFIGILALLMSFGSLIVALLAFLDKEKSSSRKSKANKNAYPV